MKKEDLFRVEEILASKKEELLKYVENHADQISYPEAASVVAGSNRPDSASSVIGYLGGGIALLIIGILTGKHWITVGGGIIALAGFYKANQQQRKQAVQTPSVDYASITERLNQDLRAIHTYISDEWKDFLNRQQTDLNKQLENSGLEIGIKNEVIKLVVKRSVIQYSMMDMLAELTRIERLHDIAAYKQYVDKFKKEYKKVIEMAYMEQKEYYEKIALYLS